MLTATFKGLQLILIPSKGATVRVMLKLGENLAEASGTREASWPPPHAMSDSSALTS